jgi:hypothetical protein
MMEILDLKFGGISVGTLLGVGWLIWAGNRMFDEWSENRRFPKELDEMDRQNKEGARRISDVPRQLVEPIQTSEAIQTPLPPSSAQNHSSGVSVGLLIVGALSVLAITVAIFAYFFGQKPIANNTYNSPSIERNSQSPPVEQNGLTRSTNDFLKNLAKDYPFTKPVR